MSKSVLPFVLLLVSCSSEERSRAVGPCGESFCLPANAELLGRQAPVEDFNLYQVTWRGTRFGIYEGNHPQAWDDAATKSIRLPTDTSATLRMSAGRGSILVNIGQCSALEPAKPCWPELLDVMGPCRSPDQCPVADFAAELSRHPQGRVRD